MTLSNTPKLIFWSEQQVQTIPEPLRRFLETTANVPEHEIPGHADELMRQARSCLESMGYDDPSLSDVGKYAIGLAF